MKIQTTVNESDEVFNRLGCIKSIIYHIAIDPSVHSKVDVPHKTQLTLRDRIQTELHQMAQSFGVNSDTTDQVNSMVTVLNNKKVMRTLEIRKT